MMDPRVIGGLVLVVGAFAGGYQVATWHAESREARQEARVDAAYRAQVDAMVERINDQNSASTRREAELAAGINTAKQDSEALRREIETRPVVTRTVEKAVNGVCPSVTAVSWSVFQRAFDCAAAPGSEACTANPGSNPVRRLVAGAVDRP